jgi:SlyX protein
MESDMSEGRESHASRLDALEIRIAHQDKSIDELNDVIAAQWRKIDMLERRLAQLREEIQNIGSTREAPEPPPPHY